jgi:hypothetical protein
MKETLWKNNLNFIKDVPMIYVNIIIIVIIVSEKKIGITFVLTLIHWMDGWTDGQTDERMKGRADGGRDGANKSNPITGLDRPLGIQEGEAHRFFRQSAHEGGTVVSPTHWPPLPPRKDSWYSFLLEAESTPGLVRPERLCQ